MAKETMSDAKNQADAELRPVLVLIQKRLRNNRKKLRGIEEIQTKADAGRALNADQVTWRGRFLSLLYFCICSNDVSNYDLQNMYWRTAQVLCAWAFEVVHVQAPWRAAYRPPPLNPLVPPCRRLRWQPSQV